MPLPALRPVLVAAVLLAALAARSAFGGSETPPEGPPWKRDFLEAQKEALKEGKPIFIYLTKTY
ncbi:MAG: hypothetical protein HYY93_01290 [Planctomycetes bacterium]|nr:hypothetical protein [Planctomycetota bacterium]